MARRNGRRGSGDRVLESRHLVGLFLGVVLLCAVFFSLGYVMGKSQYSGLVHAAYSSVHPMDADPLKETVKLKEIPAVVPASEWDFYSSKNNNHLDPAPKGKLPPVSASSSPASPSVSTEMNNSAVSPSIPERSTAANSTAESRLPRPSLPSLPSGRSGPPKMLAGSFVLQIAAVTRQGDALSVADALQRKRFSAFVVAPAADHFYRVQVGPYRDQRSADNARAALDHAGFKAIIKR
jgi:DedD protein